MSAPQLNDVIVLRIDRFKHWLPQLVRAVAQIGDTAPEKLVGPSKAPSLVTLRHAFMVAAREEMAKSYPLIGRALGGRDHSTVQYGYRTARKRCESDPEFRQLVGVVRSVARAIAQRELTVTEIEPELAL
jgi:chromosomal replication initiation ATPase DnaA